MVAKWKRYFRSSNPLFAIEGIASMHCSANVGADGDVAIFFSLSKQVKLLFQLTQNVTWLVDEHGLGRSRRIQLKVVAMLK